MRDSSLRLPAVMLTTQQAEIKAPAAAARISITAQADDAPSLTAQNPAEVLPLLKSTTPSVGAGSEIGFQSLYALLVM